LRGARVVLRALEPRDAPGLRAIRATPEVAARWQPPPEDFPFGDEPGAERLAYTAPDNAAAMRCFEKAGFRRAGVLRAAARNPGTGRWEDELLLERVVPPRTSSPGAAPASRAASSRWRATGRR
jgi:RimJ/RimL family protein N-acetyltransferase